MPDGRKNNGGARKGAGRKPKSVEIKKLEMMDSVLPPIEVWKALAKKVAEEDVPSIKFWIEHRHGKAKEIKEVEHSGSLNTFNGIVIDSDE